MDLTEAAYSEQQDRMEQDKDEGTQKIPVVKPPYKTSNQRTKSFKDDNSIFIDTLKEGSVTISKEAPDRNEPQTGQFEHGSLAVQENALEAISQPLEQTATPGEANPETYFRSPVTPRKNVIPQRRTAFEGVQQTPPVVRRNALNGAYPTELSPQPAPFPDEMLTRTTLRPVPDTGKDQDTESMIEITAALETQILPAAPKHTSFPDIPTTPLPVPPAPRRKASLTRGRAFLMALLLLIVIVNATVAGFGQFFGPQGWGSVFNNSNNNPGPNLLTQISGKFKPTPGATGQVTPPTPLQVVNAILAQMSPDEKLGQMMLVRFNGQDYSPQLEAMISQYHVGGVIFFQSNIASKSQLISLTSQMQHHANLPLIVSVDQEGGTVDRFVNLDGPQLSASSIGATGDPNKAYQQGLKDAQNLTTYGFNLNLGPVVDVTNVYNNELAGRTYGTNPTIVTTMAEAYLKGLQHSSKVLGTIKHFPGLGDTATDPHGRLPNLTRSLNDLNAIDWMPYKNMLSQNNVYSIMVTHEIVRALDPNTPSSLSPKVVGILRNQLGFKGVIITDGLTMGAIMARYTLGEAAALAVEAGDDLLMDPGSPNQVAQMINGIKEAMHSGAISQKQIDDAVRRILLFKYQMGLLHITQ